MKKISIITLVLALTLCLAACGRRDNNETMAPSTSEPTTGITILPDPTIDTNIPDPNVDTSMPMYTEGTGSSDPTVNSGMNNDAGMGGVNSGSGMGSNN